MKISSTFDQRIPVQYTCDGENKSPPLQLEGVPEEAKSLVLIMDDPDAPSGIFVHWVVYNIDPGIKEVLSGSIPKDGQQGINSLGKDNYAGPCPPDGEHRYFFKLYALDITLDFEKPPTKEKVEEAMNAHVLQFAEIVGLYSRVIS